MGLTMAKPLDPKQIVTIHELAISNMLEIEALRQLLFEKGIISKEEYNFSESSRMDANRDR
jgi:hypothetical protein